MAHFKNSQIGTLSVVAIPIGNLGDFSTHAIETLECADLILCEDTRKFGLLKKRFEINTRIESYHEQNKRKQTEKAIELLSAGENIALVSDAGTPTISDPGYRLVRACRENHIPVSSVPGPCAAIAALSISGFETDRFYFEGFLPRKSGKLKTTLEAALARECATIYYESPHRITKSLQILAEREPHRDVFFARELTKIYEETLLLSAEEMLKELQARESIKGEIVLIVRKKIA